MTIYGNSGGFIYAVMALLITFGLGMPLMFMRTKASITGRQYQGSGKAKAYFLFYRALLTGSWAKIYFRWDDLDERYNSPTKNKKNRSKGSKRAKRAPR